MERMLLDLFFSFFQIGLFSVGGGYAAIPLIQSQIVDRLHLLSLAEFTDLITIAEMTPGPIAINSATFVGTRCAGLFGAVVCTLGCMLPSFCICLALAYVYYKYRSVSGVQIVLGALRPAVVALIASAGLSILLLAVFRAAKDQIALADFHVIEAALFAACLFVLRRWKPSAVLIILGSGVVGTVLYLATGLA